MSSRNADETFAVVFIITIIYLALGLATNGILGEIGVFDWYSSEKFTINDAAVIVFWPFFAIKFLAIGLWHFLSTAFFVLIGA